MKYIGFIVTKPLQLMISISIARQIDKTSKKEFLIIDSFFGAENTSTNLGNQNEFKGCVKFFKTHRQAYLYAKNAGYEKLFIDSDVGFKKFKLLISLKITNFKTDIAVYEEGLGTYRSDLYTSTKRFLRCLGIGTHFGGCLFTSEIFLYDENEYRRKFFNSKTKVIKILTPISDLIDNEASLLNSVFNLSEKLHCHKHSKHNHCTIYLTDWSINPYIINKIQNRSGVFYLKPHPHIRDIDLPNSGFIKISPSIPAEILIKTLAKSFDRVSVIHHNSSVPRYISPPNVEFILSDEINYLGGNF